MNLRFQWSAGAMLLIAVVSPAGEPATPQTTPRSVTAPSGSVQRTQTRLIAGRSRSGQGQHAHRGELAGPTSRPAAEGQSAATERRTPGEGVFRALDQNRDGKLQPAEIDRFIDILKEARDASAKADLTTEEWSRHIGKLRSAHGKGLRGGKRASKG